MRCYEKNKNVKKRWIRNAVDKLTKLFKPKFSSKITLLVSYSVHDNVNPKNKRFLNVLTLSHNRPLFESYGSS